MTGTSWRRRRGRELRHNRDKTYKALGTKYPFCVHSCTDEESEKRCVRERAVIRGNSTSSAKEAEYSGEEDWHKQRQNREKG